ncbi:hypothetical protein [Halorubellus salinus]|nr:hypothetical protein [Halorubellus salinus]
MTEDGVLLVDEQALVVRDTDSGVEVRELTTLDRLASVQSAAGAAILW